MRVGAAVEEDEAMIKTVAASAIFMLLFGAGLMSQAGFGAEATLSDPAAKQIQSFYATLLDTMRRGPQLGIEGRYKALEPAVEASFDLPEMTRLTVGPTWTSMSESDRQKVIAAFRRMTVANYAANFNEYNGQQFVVDPMVVDRNGEKIVRSRMIPADGKAPIPFVYRMHQSGNGWKAIDVYLNGVISELATRRSDFSSTLQSGGATALTEKVNALADSLMKRK